MRNTIYLMLLLLMAACQDNYEPCYACKTTYYEDAEFVYEKDNMYCGMTDSEAAYFEKINTVSYEKDSVEVNVIINCRRNGK
jgi:hypothetical protein